MMQFRSVQNNCMVSRLSFVHQQQLILKENHILMRVIINTKFDRIFILRAIKQNNCRFYDMCNNHKMRLFFSLHFTTLNERTTAVKYEKKKY